MSDFTSLSGDLGPCLQSWEAQGFRPHGKHWLLAVSGGADSLALLRFFADRIAPQTHCRLTVAHINHHLRQESQEEEAFVAALCGRLSLACHTAHLEPAGRKRRESLEAWARRERYAALHRISQEVKADGVLTAHHRDDFVETVLLRLMRGEGWRALTGMAFQREPGLVRPFLSLPGSALRDYLAEVGQTWCEDDSNQNRRYLRNRLRLDLLPRLDGEWPNWRERLTAVGKDMQSLQGFVAEIETEDADKPVLLEPGHAVLPVESLDQPLADGDSPLVLRRLRQMMALAGGPPGKPGRPFLQGFQPHSGQTEWSAAANGVLQRRFAVGGGQQYHLLYRPIKAGNRPGKTEVKMCSEAAVKVILRPLPGIWTFRLADQDYRLTARSLTPTAITGFPAAEERQAIFDAKRISSTLQLRTRRAGDSFCPLGMRGRSRKLKDYLRDRGVPQELRDNMPLVFSDETLIWVPGVGLAESGKVLPESENLLELVLECLTKKIH